MHVALSVTDVLFEIFKSIADDLNRTQNDPTLNLDSQRLRKTLVHAALTCQTLCSPALDALYQRMNDLIPLFRLIPTFEKVNDVYIFTGRVSSNELTRFSVYASRVRELKYGADLTECIVDTSVLCRLAYLGRLPLPCLQVLKWFLPKPEFACAIHAFIVPTLKRVEVDLLNRNNPLDDEDIHAFETFLDTLTDEVPLLEHLHLHSMPLNVRLESLKALKNLRTLSISPWDGRAAYPNRFVTADLHLALASLEHLTELSIGIKEPLGLSGGASFARFENLKKFVLTGPLSCVVDTLKLSSASHLVEIKTVIESYDKGEFQSLFDVLGEQYRHLRRLSIISNASLAGHTLKAGELLAPLLHLKRLEHFALEKLDTVLVDDNDVLSMAIAWPEIQTLTLNTRSRVQYQPSLGILIHFARYCPALVSLGLSVNTGIPLPLDTPVFTHGLKELVLFSSYPPNDSLETAGFLDGLFPGLNSIPLEVWAETYKIVKFLRRVRKDHEKRLGYIPAQTLGGNVVTECTSG